MAVVILGVSAVIVTRGNEDLEPVLASLPFEEIVVWDNSKRDTDRGVYGRYAAIRETTKPFVYVQDDDCILEHASIRAIAEACLCWHHETPAVFANMPEAFRPHYPDSCLVGFGAMFARDLPAQAFARFDGGLGDQRGDEEDEAAFAELFERTCDVIFTTLTPRILLDVPYRNLDYAYGDDRMYRQPSHVGERARMLELARQVRDA